MTVKEISKVEVEQPEVTLDSAFKKRDQLQNRHGANIMIWGPPGAGKTYFSFTFPEPIYVIDTDGGSAQLLEQFPNKDIRIMDVTEAYTESSGRKKGDDPLSSTDPIVSLQNFDKATLLLKDVDKGTIVVDSISDVWEWFGAWIELVADKYTQSGQMMRTEWGKANAKYIWMIKRLKTRPCNFIMTAKQKSKYDDKGKEMLQKVVAAQKFTEYEPDFVINLDRITRPNIDTTTGKVIGNIQQRIGTVTKCRFFDDLKQVQIENPTYDLLKEKYQAKVPAWVFS